MPGSAYIFRHKQIPAENEKHVESRTDKVLEKNRAQFCSNPLGNSPVGSPASLQSFSFQNADSGSQFTYPGSGLPSGFCVPGSDNNEASIAPSGRIRRHVVDHGWRMIRDALHVARSCHMSAVDAVVSDIFPPSHSWVAIAMADLFAFFFFWSNRIEHLSLLHRTAPNFDVKS